jgi:hypothetical protein
MRKEAHRRPRWVSYLRFSFQFGDTSDSLCNCTFAIAKRSCECDEARKPSITGIRQSNVMEFCLSVVLPNLGQLAHSFCPRCGACCSILLQTCLTIPKSTSFNCNAGFKTIGEIRKSSDANLLRLQRSGPVLIAFLRKAFGPPF